MICWNYQDADPEFGYWQAKELTTHLEKCFPFVDIDILQGRRSLEIVPKSLKKRRLLKNLWKQAN